MRVLVVEDEALVALDLAEMIEDLGHAVVSTCSSSDAALDFLGQSEVDFAVLDYNLRQGTSATIADRLMALRVPFAFLTGYRPTGLPERFRDCTILAKPISFEALKGLFSFSSGSALRRPE